MLTSTKWFSLYYLEIYLMYVLIVVLIYSTNGLLQNTHISSNKNRPNKVIRSSRQIIIIIIVGKKPGTCEQLRNRFCKRFQLFCP